MVLRSRLLLRILSFFVMCGVRTRHRHCKPCGAPGTVSALRDGPGILAGDEASISNEGHLQPRVHFHPPVSGLSFSTHEVGLGQVDHFVAAAIQHCTNHVETEAPGLIETDCGRNGQLLTVHKHLNKGRAVVCQSRT